MTTITTGNTLSVFIDGIRYQVAEGLSVAAVLTLTGISVTRVSVTGTPRAPFCGMGVCQECRVMVNGVRVLACQTSCQQNMRIERGLEERYGSTM